MSALQRYLLIAALTAVYFLAGKLGLQLFGLIHPSASAVWAPTGIAIAALLLAGYRVWPAIFAGAFAVNATTAGTVFTSLGVATGNTLEALLAAFLVTRFAGGREAFSRAPDVLRFAALAALLSTSVSATIGVTSLTVGGYAALPEYGAIWFTWWLGDAAGAIIVTPLLMLWFIRRSWSFTPRRTVEALLLLALTVLTAVVIFFNAVLAAYPLAFLCLPPLVWAALRFGPREVATGVALLALMATVATVTGRGPFVMQTPNESLLVLQAFMALVAMTALPMAALMSERAALLERERAARADAEAASRAKDEFLAMLSHELRNPLSAITGAVALLDQVDENAVHEAQRWRKIIRRQSEHLTRLIDDLLDIARITVDKLSLKRQPVDLGKAVRRCVSVLASADVLRAGRIDVRCDEVWVDGDPDRIEQIIANLLNNALKYTPPEGRISVDVRRDERHAVLRVEDTGIGIRPELLPRVFEPFTQGEQGLERREGGLGVGLTLVRRLTQLHGGEVEAHSKHPEHGSVFLVKLPSIVAPRLAHAAPAETRQTSRRSYRLLLVEDNADGRRALRALLEMAGHTVVEADNGLTGLECARRLQFDFALVDIGLPHLDGYELAQRLRAENRGVRLIALTGYGREQDKERAYEAGFDAHLLKPVNGANLQAVMDALFDQASGEIGATDPIPDTRNIA